MGLASPDEAGPRITENVEKAPAVDSTLAEVQCTLAGNYFLSEWNWESAKSAFRKTIEINPKHPEAHAIFAHLLIILGLTEEAMVHAELSFKLDPHNPMIIMWYCSDLLCGHRYEECISFCSEF